MKSAKKKSTVRKAKAARPRAVSPAEIVVADAPASEAIVVATVQTQGEAIAQEIAADVAATVKLPVSCTLRETSELKNVLLESDGATALILDAAAIERVDTAGLQVITAFIRGRACRGATCEWRGLNQNVVQAAELLGLSQQLGISAAAAS